MNVQKNIVKVLSSVQDMYVYAQVQTKTKFHCDMKIIFAESRQPMMGKQDTDQTDNRKKAAKMLVAVVIVFGLCFFPVHLLNILR